MGAESGPDLFGAADKRKNAEEEQREQESLRNKSAEELNAYIKDIKIGLSNAEREGDHKYADQLQKQIDKLENELATR